MPIDLNQYKLPATPTTPAPASGSLGGIDLSKYKTAAPAAPTPFNPGNIFQTSSQPQPSTPNIAQKAANLFVGGASDLGTHLGEMAALGTGKAVTAVTGNPALENKVRGRLQTPQTNIFKAPIMPIQPGVVGAKQLGGDILKTGSEALGLTAAPASVPAAIATGGAIGAAQGAGGALQDNAAPTDVLKQAAISGGVGAATGGVLSGIGKLFGAIGDKIQTSIIKPSKADIEDGFSLATIKKYDLGGSLNATLEKTQSKLNDLSTQLSQKLKGATETVNLDDVMKQTTAELTDGSKLKGFGANAKIASGLEQLQNEVKLVGNHLSVPDAQVVKQASGSFGAWQFGKVDPESKATEIVFNTFYNKLKTAIEQASPAGVKEINQQLSQLIPVQNAIIRRLPVAQRAGAISLNDMIGLVGSSMNPIALGPTILNMLSKSGTAANALTKIGPGISRAAAPTSFATGLLPGLVSSTKPILPPQQKVSSPQSNTAKPSPLASLLTTKGGIFDRSLTPEQRKSAQSTLLGKVDPTGAVGSVEKLGLKAGAKALADIHPDDLYLMQKFITHARLDGPLSDGAFAEATKLAQHFGISMDKGLKGVANSFEAVLAGAKKVKGTVVAARDAGGRFTKNKK